MSRRGLIIVILSACAVLGLAIWGGTLIGSSRANQQQKETQAQLTSAQYELSQVQSSYTALQLDNVTLRTQLMSTENALSQMQSGYVGLQQDNVTVRTQLMSTQNALSQTQSGNTGSQQDNAKLQSQLTALTLDYNNLATRYDTLQKTKEFVVDSRLKVELTTEQQFGAMTWVRGQVTNIGSSTVQKIYVLVSRYKTDGSLDGLDLPPAILLNLVPGGAGQFSFVATGSNYKVTVLGDY